MRTICEAGRVGENWSACGALCVPLMLMDYFPATWSLYPTGHVPGAIPLMRGKTGIEWCAHPRWLTGRQTHTRMSRKYRVRVPHPLVVAHWVRMWDPPPWNLSLFGDL